MLTDRLEKTLVSTADRLRLPPFITAKGRADGDAAIPAGTWADLVAAFRHAFQPIVQMRTGACHGYEALLRGWDRFGFSDPLAVMDAAQEAGVLRELETALHAKAVDTFCSLPGWRESKLFLNVSTQLLGTYGSLAAPARGRPVSLVHEISERDPIPDRLASQEVIDRYRREAVGMALDDFGVGFAGLKLLHEARPDYVKIDRFFIAGIETDPRKRAIVSYLVGSAHALGVAIIAEGIETPEEFFVCRDLGCDFAQGYLLGAPTLDYARLDDAGAVTRELNQRDRRRAPPPRERLAELVEPIPALAIDSPKSVLLAYFGGLQAPPIVPVLDRNGRPRGLVRERDLKPFVYSQYGSDLLRNKAFSASLTDFVVPCPIVDIDTPLEGVVEAFSDNHGSDGVIIVQAGSYVGLLSSHAILRLVHERKLAAATDQNPLTRLPGNNAIIRHIDDMLANDRSGHGLVYFDFDNFKPFNDHYGFRQGDRAILMFSERLKVLAAALGGFAGHIGGDDFFLAVSDVPEAVVQARLLELGGKFRADAESLYDSAARDDGGFVGKDRDGNPRRFPLLTVSAVLVSIAAGPDTPVRPEQLITLIAENKAAAKNSPDKLCRIRL